jgi:hypothetical protein
MATQSQFGHTLFLDGFEAGCSAERLRRLHFSKDSSETSQYNEAWLQRLIMRQPSILPIDQIEPAFDTIIPVCIELPMKCGFLDNLFVTPTGDLALVECKLWRNPEARREVVAQIIDYAKEISGWTYETLQNAVQRAPGFDSDGQFRPSLYETVSSTGQIDESSFHDAVSRNLKRGRFLLLIVGDGIREGVEGMAEFLQQHAGFHFTLAFVEIALFEIRGGYIAQPRVLARTTNIDRGVVRLDEGRIVFAPCNSDPRPGSRRGTTLTQEEYFERLERELSGISLKLNGFLDDLGAYNVFAEFGTESMILRWRPDNGRDWNLGTISKRGLLWLDLMGGRANSEGLLEIHKQFLQKLVDLVPGAYIRKTRKETTWYVAQDTKDHYISVDALLASETRKNGWIRAIVEFQAAVMQTSNNE